MKVAIVLACLVATALAVRNAEWENFKTSYGRKYKNAAEEEHRQRIFMDNLRTIEQHNARFEKGAVSFTLRVNQFADMTTKEFASKMNGYKSNPKPSEGKPFVNTLIGDVPDKVDWRNEGYVTPVKDQGQCGACWAFSATGSLEGQHFAKTGELISLSEQNLMDCSRSYGNKGCSGGWMDQAFQYIIDNNGDDTEAAYPYEEQVGLCRFDSATVGATATGYVDIPFANEDALLNATAIIGPVSVTIDASHISFQLYGGGVYDEPECSQVILDHGVLVAGYGTDLDKDFWLVKNSWGNTWGLQGYIEMTRDGSNQCGIASKASYPTV